MTFVWCITIILILVIIHTLWPKYVYYNYCYYDCVDVIKQPPDIEMQTGDIIFFRSCNKCKYTESILNNAFIYTCKNTFDSFRWYIMNQQKYTHVAVVIRLKDIPYIVHIDGGDPMYDELEKKWISQTSCAVTSVEHINVRSGIAHLFRYTGPPIEKNMEKWVEKNRNIKYPESIINLIKVNGFKLDKNPDGVYACTDFVESSLNYMGIIDKKNVSRQATIEDVYKLIINNNNYSSDPIILKNKCYNDRHLE